jgi:predicted transcriptional regulator
VLYDQQDKTVQEIADYLSINRATAYRFLTVANQLENEQ